MFIKLGHILPIAINKFQVAKEIKAAEILAKYRTASPDILGKRVNFYTQARSFSKGILLIGVKNQIWGEEIHQKKKEMIKRLNKEIGRPMISEIRTCLGFKDKDTPTE